MAYASQAPWLCVANFWVCGMSGPALQPPVVLAARASFRMVLHLEIDEPSVHVSTLNMDMPFCITKHSQLQ